MPSKNYGKGNINQMDRYKVWPKWQPFNLEEAAFRASLQGCGEVFYVSKSIAEGNNLQN